MRRGLGASEDLEARHGNLTATVPVFNAASTSPVAEMARNALAGGSELENPRKRPRVSSESSALEISTLLKNIEKDIAGQLKSIAAGQESITVGQESIAAMCTKVEAKQDNIYQKLKLDLIEWSTSSRATTQATTP